MKAFSILAALLVLAGTPGSASAVAPDILSNTPKIVHLDPDTGAVLSIKRA
ncbi:hypothetical protein GCM10010124_29030 [Pilimelia terevasa]|uniref:D-alanyl-D-alanine carboxypeptidase n=1 Tax=Pilimelia terevasa TaxID=53372 RepID=A0A8J3FJR7_9ACTN|nr:hypothetical protein [Pilimelia terevasa]GGK34563.1 hypothetical protein GCM10010124_29030 [Pilimelia terevasa]